LIQNESLFGPNRFGEKVAVAEAAMFGGSAAWKKTINSLMRGHPFPGDPLFKT